MAEFHYSAVNSKGAGITGTIDASDQRAAISALAREGKFVTEFLDKRGRAEKKPTVGSVGSTKVKISAGAVGSLFSGISSKYILAYTSQLSTALNAGLGLLEALRLIAKQQSKVKVRELLDGLADDVSGGKSFSEALALRRDVFSPLYISMVTAGETAGILEETLSRLSELLEREQKVKSSLINASIYPLCVMALGIASVIIVITVVLPRVFETIGSTAAMPLPTQILIKTSDFITSFWHVLLFGTMAVFIVFYRWKKTESGRLSWDGFLLKIPVMGSVLKTIAVGRFARTLGALTKGGITILDALEVVRDTLGNEVLARGIDSAAEDVRSGSSVAEPLDRTGIFPPLLIQIVSVGEHTGKLDELLLNAANTFDQQADDAVQRFMAFFPTALIVLLALVIGFIIAATLLPIMMMQLGGGVI